MEALVNKKLVMMKASIDYIKLFLAYSCRRKQSRKQELVIWTRHGTEDDRMLTDQCDFMDYIDEELAAILGEDFPGSQSPQAATLRLPRL
ncbi:hypothetical protein Pfo_008530 [Paulownia fortunei]|nr:hypothetical protein Pfo_008530 [Paulownia fortunei]